MHSASAHADSGTGLDTLGDSFADTSPHPNTCTNAHSEACTDTFANAQTYSHRRVDAYTNSYPYTATWCLYT